MNAEPCDVVVLGGGISGLTAAWHLHRAGVDVALVESDRQVGGYTRTEQRDGFLLEKGPFNVIVRDPSFEALLEGLGDKVRVVTAGRDARVRYIYRRGKLHPVPSNPVALATTPLLSPGGRLRLVSGLLLSARPRHAEETIAQAATRRIGPQAAEHIVSAAISGIFAGDIRKLSLAACFPGVWKVDCAARSLLAHGLTAPLRRRRGGQPTHRRRWRGLVSLEGGLGSLTRAIGESLGDRLLTGCRVESLELADGGYDVRCRREGASVTLHTHRVVCALSARQAAEQLSPLRPQLADLLRSIPSSSLAVLNLAFRRTDVGHSLKGFGFLVPHSEPDFPLMGVLFADSVFPHHAPPDTRLLRVFIGGAHRPSALEASDEELVRTSLDVVRPLLDLRGEPILTDLSRYLHAIPQYHLGHQEKVKLVLDGAAGLPGFHLVGNYLEGVSLNDCVRLATRVATELIQASPARESRQPNASTTRHKVDAAALVG